MKSKRLLPGLQMLSITNAIERDAMEQLEEYSHCRTLKIHCQHPDAKSQEHPQKPSVWGLKGQSQSKVRMCRQRERFKGAMVLFDFGSESPAAG